MPSQHHEANKIPKLFYRKSVSRIGYTMWTKSLPQLLKENRPRCCVRRPVILSTTVHGYCLAVY